MVELAMVAGVTVDAMAAEFFLAVDYLLFAADFGAFAATTSA